MYNRHVNEAQIPVMTGFVKYLKHYMTQILSKHNNCRKVSFHNSALSSEKEYQVNMTVLSKMEIFTLIDIAVVTATIFFGGDYGRNPE